MDSESRLAREPSLQSEASLHRLTDRLKTVTVFASLLFACVGFTGCICVPRYVPAPPNAKVAKDRSISPNAFPVYTNTPRRDYHFTLGQKLNPIWCFGNADDPVPPDWYRPGKSARSFTWAWRNPCHNFTFYVVGIGDKTFTRVGRYPGTISNPNGGWNWAVSRYGYWRFPSVAYDRHRFHFYFGWRRGGNFGVKLNFTPLNRYG
jgi:hypothetical protein